MALTCGCWSTWATRPLVFGPEDVRAAHRPDEYVPVEELVAVVHTLMALRFCGHEGQERATLSGSEFAGDLAEGRVSVSCVKGICEVDALIEERGLGREKVVGSPGFGACYAAASRLQLRHAAGVA